MPINYYSLVLDYRIYLVHAHCAAGVCMAGRRGLERWNAHACAIVRTRPERVRLVRVRTYVRTAYLARVHAALISNRLSACLLSNREHARASALLLPIVLGRVTCKCTRSSFQLPVSI